MNPYTQNAGYVTARRNVMIREGWVVLYDAADPQAGLDPSGGRWITVCELHGTTCCHTSKKQAIGHLPYVNWCDECMKAVIS